jgi:hypothetical protein
MLQEFYQNQKDKVLALLLMVVASELNWWRTWTSWCRLGQVGGGLTLTSN